MCCAVCFALLYSAVLSALAMVCPLFLLLEMLIVAVFAVAAVAAVAAVVAAVAVAAVDVCCCFCFSLVFALLSFCAV